MTLRLEPVQPARGRTPYCFRISIQTTANYWHTRISVDTPTQVKRTNSVPLPLRSSCLRFAENPRVVGSIPTLATNLSRVYSGHMGNGLFRRHG